MQLVLYLVGYIMAVDPFKCYCLAAVGAILFGNGIVAVFAIAHIAINVLVLFCLFNYQFAILLFIKFKLPSSMAP